MSHKPDSDKICFHAKDPYKTKYQLPINKRESSVLKHLNHSKVFIAYSNDMDDIHKNIEEYNPNKNRKLLTAFDDKIVAMLSDRQCTKNEVFYYAFLQLM